MAASMDTIELCRLADGAIVEARVVGLTRKLAQTEIDTKWWQIPNAGRSLRQQENDHGWQWAKRLGELVNDRWHEAIAVQTDDERVQGAILYWLNTQSFIEQDVGAVYVEALATAPRNRPWLVTLPAYRGVGEALLLRAVIHSHLLGFEGRVNLLAFNDPKLISFYLNRGFTIVGHDEDDEKLPRLELTPDAARLWLGEEGYEL